jgi:hypothetical protein
LYQNFQIKHQIEAEHEKKHYIKWHMINIHSHKIFSLLLLTFLLWPKVHIGQSLSISELIKFRSLDYGDLNDILVAKGWEFVKNENGKSTWAFSKYNNKANAWLYKVKDWENKFYINYVFCNIKDITVLKSQLSALGFVKNNSEAYSSSITTYYTNTNYSIAITYIASEDDFSCDTYSVNLVKLKSLQERQREEKINEEARLAEIQKQKLCEISTDKRKKRNAYFITKVDSFNNSIDIILDIKYQKHQNYLMNIKKSNHNQFIENKIQDSIEVVQLLVDSIATIEAEFAAAMASVDDFIPSQIKYGISKQSVLIYEYPQELSKAKSGLFKNERIKIIGSFDDFYKIQFDYCNEIFWDNNGYVRKSDLKLENKIQTAKPKKK